MKSVSHLIMETMGWQIVYLHTSTGPGLHGDTRVSRSSQQFEMFQMTFMVTVFLATMEYLVHVSPSSSMTKYYYDPRL